jgi:hypothetical protein
VQAQKHAPLTFQTFASHGDRQVTKSLSRHHNKVWNGPRSITAAHDCLAGPVARDSHMLLRISFESDSSSCR